MGEFSMVGLSQLVQAGCTRIHRQRHVTLHNQNALKRMTLCVLMRIKISNINLDKNACSQ